MTCYFRHLGEVFKKAGIEVTPLNRKQLDEVIHELVKTNYKDCPSTWREVKKRIAADEDAFAKNLKAAWNSQQEGEK
jgi:predicted Fe-Mo cluster-binding NifX family protein